MRNDQWQGEFGICYAVGAVGVEELGLEYEDYLDELEQIREVDPKEQVDFEAWLQEQADDIFGPREVA